MLDEVQDKQAKANEVPLLSTSGTYVHDACISCLPVVDDFKWRLRETNVLIGQITSFFSACWVPKKVVTGREPPLNKTNSNFKAWVVIYTWSFIHLKKGTFTQYSKMASNYTWVYVPSANYPLSIFLVIIFIEIWKHNSGKKCRKKKKGHE